MTRHVQTAEALQSVAFRCSLHSLQGQMAEQYQSLELVADAVVVVVAVHAQRRTIILT